MSGSSFKKQPLLNRAFRETMSKRNIEDITLKMKAIRNIPEDQMIRLFFDMCNYGIKLYLQEEKQRFPGKTESDIMREYHQTKIKSRKSRELNE